MRRHCLDMSRQKIEQQSVECQITVFCSLEAFFKKDKGEAAKREIHLKEAAAEEEQKQ